MNYSVGVDMGGTKTAIAVVGQSGGIVTSEVISTDLSIRPVDMIKRISEKVKHIIRLSEVNMDQIVGVGIGAPGPLDSKNGVLTCPPNLSGWINIPIQQLVQRTLSLPVTVENDANAAALGEKWVGAAKENDHFVYMTVSTGVGAGIVADGKLLRGLKGNAGDFGHTVIDPSFGKCTCGQYGCLESIASGTAIAKRGSEIMKTNLTTKEVFALYREGNTAIVDYIDQVFRVLGVACVSLINTFDPEKIVIGGGVSKVGDPLFQSIREYVRTYALNPTGRQAEIVPANLELNAGVIGAAALCFNVL